MKLEVGMYVRTKDGEIVKIKHIEDVYTSDGIYIANVIYFGDCFHINSDEVIKASYNIIDLIEVGDYVNGYLIEKFYDTYNPKTEEYEDILGIAIYDDARMDCIEEIRPLRTLDIKSVVTKEQFESMSYKVEVEG